MIYDFFSRIDGGDSYVNPWSKECAKNTTEKLKQFGNQLEGLHQGEGERERLCRY
jgi:hypothetical protein